MSRPRLGFVTGAASGLGLALARAMAEQGRAVFLTDIAALPLAEVAERIRLDYGGDVGYRTLDVANPTDWAAALEKCETQHGHPDVVILNAGVTTGGRKVLDIDPDDWDWLFSINVRGVLNGMQAVVPRMQAQGTAGRIVVMASVLSHFGLAGAADYVASKHAVLGLSETLRLELEGSGITLTVACPGLVQTELAANRARLRPAPKPASAGTGSFAARPSGISPEAAARIILAAGLRGDYLVYTHPEYQEAVASRSRVTTCGTGIPATGEDVAFLAGGAMRLHESAAGFDKDGA